MHVMIDCLDGPDATGLATSRKGPDFHFRFGIDRNPQHFRGGVCARVNYVQVGEDRVGFGDVF